MAKKRRRGGPRALPVRVVPRAEGGTALEVGGVVQSVAVPPSDGSASPADEPAPGPHDGYWGLMLPPGCPRRALLLGLGGGTVAWLLARRCPQAALLGVERDAEVLTAGRASFGLDALPTLRIEQADAFEWVAARVVDTGEAEPAREGGERFDLICLDLFQGGRMAQGALGTPFLRQVAALLAPGGVLTVNLLVTARTPDHLHRLRRVFAIERELRLRGNLVVHARPLPPALAAEGG